MNDAVLRFEARELSVDRGPDAPDAVIQWIDLSGWHRQVARLSLVLLLLILLLLLQLQLS